MCDVVDWKLAGTAGPFACGAAARRRSVVAGRIVADAGRPCRSPTARAIIGPDHGSEERGAMSEYDAPTPDYGSLLRLDGRAYAVIGAGDGMGRQTAIALSSQGGRVLCVDIDAGRAAAVAAEV